MNHNQNDKYECICHGKAQQDEKSYNGCIVCLIFICLNCGIEIHLCHIDKHLS